MFWETFYNLCEAIGTTPSAVVAKLGIANGATTKWKRGSVPSGKSLQKIADYFNVSVDYLLGKEKEPSGKTGEFDELTMQFNNLLGKLSQEQKEALIPLLESMIQQKK